MVLCWRRHGRVGGCQILKKENAKAFHYIDVTGINQWLDESRNWFMQWLIKISQVIAIWPYIVPWKLHIESKRILILLIIVRSIVRHPNYSNKILFEKTNRLNVATLGNRRSKVKLERDLPAQTVNMVKLIRAQGGCLGTKSRRKTW